MVFVALDFKRSFDVHLLRYTKKKIILDVSISPHPPTVDRYLSIYHDTTTPQKENKMTNLSTCHTESDFFVFLTQMDGTCSNTHLP